MTREEAIAVLEIIREEYRTYNIFSPRLPALEMAIEALKPPKFVKCEDCVYKGLLSDDDMTFCTLERCLHLLDFHCKYGKMGKGK